MSYSCCRNIGSVKSSQNWRVFQSISNYYGCNFRNRAECSLDDKYLTAYILYKAVVSALSKPGKRYFGIAETTFKERFRNHTRDFYQKKVR